jgi:hypothetical protein
MDIYENKGRANFDITLVGPPICVSAAFGETCCQSYTLKECDEDDWHRPNLAGL